MKPRAYVGRKPRIAREQYLLMRIRRHCGASLRTLAEDYGYTVSAVSKICRAGLKRYETQRPQETRP